MKKVSLYISVLCLCLIFSSCNELEVSGENYPDHNSIDPQSMDTDLPRVNINVDQADYDFLYGNYEENILIDVYVDYYESDGTKRMDSVPAQMEIKGATSAHSVLKSLGLIFDNSIDNESIRLLWPDKILSNHDLTELKAVRLRNSGNDFDDTMIKDISYTQIGIDADMNLDLMYYRQTVAFLNNKFLGVMNLRTESSAQGISHLYGIDSTNLTLMKMDNDNGNLEYHEGPVAPARELFDAVRNDDYKTIIEWVDMDSFIDYIIFQDYIGNSDWPHNNSRAFSVNGAKFRFFVYDLDFAVFNTKNPRIPELEYQSDDISKIYQALLKSPDFSDKLEARMEVVYKRFSTEKFRQTIERNATRIEDEMLYQIGKYNSPSSHLLWQMKVDQHLREMNQRDKYMRRFYDLE